MKFKKLNNIFTKGAISSIMLILIVSSFLFLPGRAQAQFIVNDTVKTVRDAVKWAWDKGGAVAYRNSLNFFLQQAAKQSGEWLATGDVGKKPAFLTDPDFYKKAGDQMLGEFVDSVAGNFLGQSLCDTLDPTVKFNMLATLDPNYNKMKWAKEPKCSFTQIKKNLKDASKKKLFEFSADVKEGKVAKQRSSISTIIQGDPILTEGMKHILDGKLDICPGDGKDVLQCPAGAINCGLGNVFYFYEEGYIGVGAQLHKYTNEFEDILSALRHDEKVIELAPGEEAPELDPKAPINQTAAAAFKDLKEKLDPKEGKELWGDLDNATKLKFLDKWSSECSRKSPSDVCDENKCVLMCDIGGADLCKASEESKSECYNRIKRVNKYTKQLIEWATTLYDMITQVTENWEAQQGMPDLDPLEDASNMFNPESNPMGMQMELKSKLFKKQTDAIEKSKTFRDIQGSMNAVTSKVSGIVKLPSTFVNEKARESVKSGKAGPLTTTGVAFADAVGIFANTFLTQYAKVFIEGLNPAADSSRVTTTSDEDETPNPDTTSILSDIKVIPINQSSNEMTIYDEFAVCPTGTDQKYKSQFNCLLDNKLARAVEERMTIQEAMANGLLNQDERLGIRGDKSGLLSKNHIQKLRLIGILPLGAQIASEIIMEGPHTSSGVTLSDVVDGFDKRGEDGICGTSDTGESEFCNLVDPNWVLKAPSYLCEITGYSAVPLRDSSFRQESCLDLKTCINETESNQCDTWSYCTREKNVWRFGGNECDSQYNTCTSYVQKSSKEISSYLSNTLDFDNCSASNVGCKWYCSRWDQTYSGVGGDWACTSPGWRQYTCYLGDVCNASNGCDCACDGDNGCPDGLGNCLVAMGGISCSLEMPELRNVAFFSDQIKECQESNEGCSQYIRTKPGMGVNFLSNGSFELPSKDEDIPIGWQVNGPVQQITPLSRAQNGSNVVQIQNTETAVDCQLSQSIYNIPSQGDFVVSGYYRRNDTVSSSPNMKVQICYDNNCSDKDEIVSPIDFNDNNWKYVSVSLSSDKEKIIDHIEVFAFDSPSFTGNVYVDTMQLRNEPMNSSYREYGSKGITYLKSAMGWMNCYDSDENNDDVDCENFVQKCSLENVGCELYSPVDNNMSDIPALVNDSDLCPYSCVGYETFEEMPTNFENNQDKRLVHLIPSTAQKCSAPGCEEFTNLDAVSDGGEGREYYTYLRQCIKTNAQGMAIVNSSGNQISPASADTCQYYYTWVGEDTSGYQLKKYYLEADSSLGGPAQVSQNPNSEWGLCDEDNLDNPHCRQFYDAMGNVYYRLYKNTTTCSTDCSPYRRVIDNSIEMAIGAEAEVCNASDMGCREYKGSTYGNIKNLFLDKFISSSEPWENVEISYESISYLGNSIKANANLAKRPVDGLVQKGKAYSLSLWVKGSGNYIASFGNDLYFITSEPHNISVTSNDWQEIRFGSIYFNRNPENDEKLIIQGPNQFYLDNITLNEIQDNVYLIKDSWNTPEVCDIDDEGNVSLGYMLGCQAYRDRFQDAHYLKSFSNLCPEKEVGCEAMIDTQNSTSPFSEEFNSGSPQGDEIIIPSDNLIYRVYDTGKSCLPEDKGCQRFGLPELDSNQEAIDFTDVYLLNNPDLYKLQSTLCDIEGEGCQEYEGQVYFKEPTDNVCEYRENVFVGGENKNGWFKKGTKNPCYTENGFAYQPYGSVYGIRTNKDSLYEGIVGICPESQNGCTRFINPVEQNLVLNGGFELDKNEDNIPDGWAPYADPENSFSLVTDGCLSGSCWRVNQSMDMDSFSAGRQYIKIQPGSTYELSAWIKATDDSSGNSKIYLAYTDSASYSGPTWPWGIIISEQTGSTDGKWIKHTVTLKAPTDAAYASILAPYVNGRVDMMIDNISLIEKNSPKGSYYYLSDGNIDETSCNGMVGIKDGCVLFNNTSFSGKQYDSAYTYALSEAQGDTSVPAQSVVNPQSDNEGDSNVVLKVRRDRVCGEWLQCSGYRSVWDSSIDEYRPVCDSWIRCDELIGSGKQAQCGHVVSNPNPSVLNKNEYISRDVSWAGMDYSGYSLPNMYPVEKLFLSEDNNNPGLYTLTYFNNENNNVGVDGGGLEDGLRIGKTTRIYAEKDSPFKSSASTNYNKVNLCDSGEGTGYPNDNTSSLYPDCQGSYQKVEYGDEYSGLTKYYNFDADSVDSRKVCKYSGKNCTGKDPSYCETQTPNDVCISPNKITQVIGLRGFCLERDESRPEDTNACITWWPGASAGDVDVYNMHYSAGYVPDSSRKWYCASDDSNSIFGDSVIAFNSSSNSFCYDHSGTKERYILLDGDSCPVDWECKVASPIPFNVIKMGEIEKIEVKLGADDGKNCSSLECNKVLVLDSSNRYWGSIQYNDPLVGSSHCNNRSTWPDHTTFPRTPSDGWHGTDIRACFDAECLDANFANWTYDEESYLHHFIWHSYDRSSSSGGSGSLRWIKIYLKNGCKYLVNAVPANNDGLAIGYTDRLWEHSDYYSVIDPPRTPGTGGTECIPYGVADITTAGRLTFVGDNPEPNPYECESNKANIVYNKNGLQQLFVKVGDVEEFNKNEMSYNPVTNANSKWLAADWDMTELAASAGDAPKITSVNGSVNALTIGNYEGDDIGPERSPFVANLKFYAWADTNHMPIREISIDWDNGSQPNFYNVISKNHRPECKQPDCGDPADHSCWEFGLSPEACIDKYFSFNHTYTCEGEGSLGWNEYGCNDMCCFKPKVYVKDNWGWCVAGSDLEGVYVGWDDDGYPNACKSESTAGIPYGGIIKVSANN